MATVALEHPGQDEPRHMEGRPQVHVHEQVDGITGVLDERVEAPAGPLRC